MSPPGDSLHVILGAGQVGTQLADRLLADGLRVRVVRRGAPGPERPGLEWRSGDLGDVAFARAACAGAAVVYHVTNPPHYHRWAEELPPLGRAALEGARSAGAKLVVLDNLYMVGRPDKVPFDEDVPMRPCSRKGELRKRLVDDYLAAHARGEVRFTSGRASDFFGPGASAMSGFGDHLASCLRRKKPVEVFGNPDLPRSYSYIPDVARGLALLGTREEAMSRRVWHLPVAWQGTTRELVARIGAALGVEAKVRPVSDFMLAIIGVFVPMLGAIREMTYQWKIPYLVDDGRFRAAFGVEPTPADEAIRAAAEALRGRVTVAASRE
jgi:nucleoside-diphosphate-sugar epimerase